MSTGLREEVDATWRRARSRFAPLPSIALVSRDEPARALVERTLESVGYPVLSFAPGDGLLPALEPSLPEIGALVLDFDRPAMLDLELVRRATRSRPSMPVILLSPASPGHLRRQIALPAEIAILQKPFLPSELLVQIDSGLRAVTLLGVSTRSYSRVVP